MYQLGHLESSIRFSSDNLSLFYSGARMGFESPTVYIIVETVTSYSGAL